MASTLFSSVAKAHSYSTGRSLTSIEWAVYVAMLMGKTAWIDGILLSIVC